MEHESFQEITRIAKTSLGLLDEDLLRNKLSVAHVTIHEKLYDNNVPTRNGINDLRMGSLEFGGLCATCGRDSQTCPGHFGHITLSHAVFHPGFIRCAHQLLECVCWACATCLVNNELPTDAVNHQQETGVHDIPRLSLLSKQRKSKVCPHCSSPVPKYTKVNLLRIQWEWTEEQLHSAPHPDVLEEMRRPFTAARARMIFNTISPTILTQLGIPHTHAHPRNYILRVLPVPPPHVRPAVSQIEQSKSRGQDDLTLILHSHILKSSNMLRRNSLPFRPRTLNQDDGVSALELKRRACQSSGSTETPKPEYLPLHIIDEQRVDALVDLTRPGTTRVDAALQARPSVRTCEHNFLFHSKAVDQLEQYLLVYLHADGRRAAEMLKQRSGRPVRTLAKRFKDKGGRLRGNLMGKRAYSTARSVVAPCNSLDADEVGVPEWMARVLTVGMVGVTRANASRLKQCVRRGAHAVGGAERVVKADGRVIFLDYVDNVCRVADELRVGDQVERYLNEGDPVIVNRQPTLHKMGIMVHRTRIMPGFVIRLNLAVTTPYNADFDGDEMNLHVPKGEQARSEALHLMSIKHCLVSPATNTMSMGIVQDGIIAGMLLSKQDTFLERDQAMQLLMACRYLDDWSLPIPAVLVPCAMWTGKQILSKLFPSFLQLDKTSDQRGATYVSLFGRLDGCMHQEESHVRIQDGALLHGRLTKRTLSKAITHRIAMDASVQRGVEFMSDVQRMLHEWMGEYGFSMGFDDCLLPPRAHRRVFRTAREGMIAPNMFARMGTSGDTEERARRLVAHVSMQATQVGYKAMKQSVESRFRPRNGLWDMITSQSKGGKANIFQIAVAVGQQVVEGRRIPQGLDSAHPKDALGRGFCRNSYVDGLNALEFFMHNAGGREGLVNTSTKTAYTGYLQRCMIKGMEDVMAAGDGTVRASGSQIVQFSYGGDGMDPTKLEAVPCSLLTMRDDTIESMLGDPSFTVWFLALRRKVLRCRTRSLAPALEHRILLPANPEKILHEFRRGAWKTSPHAHNRAVFANDVANTGDLYADIDHTFPLHSQLTLKLMLCWALRPSVLQDTGASLVARMVVAETLRLWHRAWVASGEPCGIISAQSIGEPSTQLTLNSFHHSGRGETRVSMGVPRLREIIDGRKEGNIKTPMMIIPVVDNTEESANRIARSITRVRLRDALQSSFVCQDPIPETDHAARTNVTKDHDLMETIAQVYGSEKNMIQESATASRYVIRFSLQKAFLLRMGLTPRHMGKCIERVLGTPCIMIVSPPSMRAWVIRVRPVVSTDAPPPDAHTVQLMHNFILKQAAANASHAINKAVVGKAEVSQVSSEGGISVVDRWVVQAHGSSLHSLAGMANVDWNHTHTNDVTMVARVLGVEAANSIIYEQLHRVLMTDGSHFDARHLQLLADAMTYMGFVMPIRRHGILRKHSGWAHRASFEETNKVLTTAALRVETDSLDNPSGSTMTGQLGSFGTGNCAVVSEPGASVDLTALGNAWMGTHARPRPFRIDGRTGEESTDPNRVRMQAPRPVVLSAVPTTAKVDMSVYQGRKRERVDDDSGWITTHTEEPSLLWQSDESESALTAEGIHILAMNRNGNTRMITEETHGRRR